MNDVVISRATADDEEALRKVSRACYEDDYVLTILDDMLQSGTLLLARTGDEAVGFVYLDRAMDGSTWLSSLRVVPSRRRQGVGIALCQGGDRVAAAAGSQEIRLWTAESNTAARALFEGMSYRHIADFTRWWRAVESEPPTSPQPVATFADVDQDVEKSALLRASRGYVPLALKFCRFDDRLPQQMAESGRLYVDPNGNPLVLDEEIWEKFESPTVELTLLGDELEGAVEAAVGHAASVGRQGVGTYLPYGEPWAKEAERAGLEIGTWGRHARLYRKRIL